MSRRRQRGKRTNTSGGIDLSAGERFFFPEERKGSACTVTTVCQQCCHCHPGVETQDAPCDDVSGKLYMSENYK